MKEVIVFRKVKEDGEIIAFFPNTEFEVGRNLKTCYAHNGQHGPCGDYYIRKFTEPCNEDEYKSLHDELISIGYDLEIIEL